MTKQSAKSHARKHQRAVLAWSFALFGLALGLVYFVLLVLAKDALSARVWEDERLTWALVVGYAMVIAALALGGLYTILFAALRAPTDQENRQ